MLSVQAAHAEARVVVIGWHGLLPSDVSPGSLSQPAWSGNAASELCALASQAWLGAGHLGHEVWPQLPASAGPDRGEAQPGQPLRVAISPPLEVALILPSARGWQLL